MIRLGVIGCGRRIYGVIGKLRQFGETVVTGIVDPDETGVRARLNEADREAVFYPDLPAMVKGAKPDALLIGTRCRLHTDNAIEAAQFGLPLFLEKPVAINLEQAARLERCFAAAPGPTMVSFPLRVSPICEMVHGLLADGAVGRPEHIAAFNYVPYGTVYFDDFYRDYANTQGLFLQKATHDLDYLMHLAGSPIVRVAAMASKGRVFGGDKPAGLRCSACPEGDACPESPANRRRNQSGGTYEDHFCVFGRDIGTPATGMNEDSSSILMEFASGLQAVYTQVFFSRRDAARRGAIISGYDGTVEFDWCNSTIRRVRHHRPFTDAIQCGSGLAHFGGDDELARDFIALIRTGAKPRVDIRDGLRSVYACLAANESVATGRFIDVRQLSF